MKWHNIELEAENCQIKSSSAMQLRGLYNNAGVQQKELENKILKKIPQVINETLTSLIGL